jgi:hypothetical protein
MAVIIMIRKLKYTFTVMCIQICLLLNGQNFITNSSFETHFDCSYNGIENSTPWCGVNACSYLNSCMTGSVFTVPTQFFSPGYPSHQLPHSGNAYATFGFILPTQPAAVLRYPHVSLKDTLLVGKIYCVTYYVSLMNDCQYSADRFGALFTSVPFNCTISNQTLTTGYTPQVVTTPGVLYDDTLGWQEVSDTFMATGTEAYLTIGNFFPQAQHTYSISYPASPRPVAEYYLDDVSVEEVQHVICRNDTLIYSGDSAVVGANLGEANLYSWQPTTGLSCTNCPNPKASPTITTTYTVTKTQCKAVTTDIITVTVSPVGINEFNISNAITLLPNPTNGIVNISSRYDMQRIEVMNVAGQILLSELVNAKEHQLQLESFAEGIYFVRVSYANGQNVSKKIVKQ